MEKKIFLTVAKSRTKNMSHFFQVPMEVDNKRFIFLEDMSQQKTSMNCLNFADKYRLHAFVRVFFNPINESQMYGKRRVKKETFLETHGLLCF